MIENTEVADVSTVEDDDPDIVSDDEGDDFVPVGYVVPVDDPGPVDDDSHGLGEC